MARIGEILHKNPWLLDDNIPKGEMHTANAESLQSSFVRGKNFVEKKRRAVEILQLPLTDNQRRILSLILEGRRNDDLLSCAIEVDKETSVSASIRSVPELWFSEYLGAVSNGNANPTFRSRELLDMGFPVGNYRDMLMPVGKVLRKFVSLDIVDKISQGATVTTSYEVKPFNSVQLEVAELPQSYDFHV